jgi:LEM3 (ligand-effect modulator 3) family / CDC50 family
MKISPNPEHSTERKPNDSAFRQSTMKAYKPVPTVKSAAIIFTILGIIFIIVGSVLLAYSKEIIEHSQRYDNQNECANTSWNYSTTCQVSFYLDKKMNPPIYFYYQLNNFYQNHRRYVKSKSADQLQGSILTKDSVSSDCDPIVSMQDLGRTANQLSSSNLKAHAGDSNFVANPCGLIAQTLFNDTYQIQSSNGTAIFIDETNIAWPSDKEKKFKRAANWQDIQWTDVENGI